jgi:hypothetical protein
MLYLWSMNSYKVWNSFEQVLGSCEHSFKSREKHYLCTATGTWITIHLLCLRHMQRKSMTVMLKCKDSKIVIRTYIWRQWVSLCKDCIKYHWLMEWLVTWIWSLQKDSFFLSFNFLCRNQGLIYTKQLYSFVCCLVRVWNWVLRSTPGSANREPQWHRKILWMAARTFKYS